MAPFWIQKAPELDACDGESERERRGSDRRGGKREEEEDDRVCQFVLQRDRVYVSDLLTSSMCSLSLSFAG